MKPADRNSTSRESTLSSALSGERFFLLLAIIIGAFSGLAVVLFRLFIDWVGNVFLGTAPAKHDIRLVLVPALVSLVIGALVIHVFPRTRGSGVNQTKAALYIYDGYISLRTAVGKFLTAGLAIGAGHSLGPEDPSLQIGAALASFIGRKLRLRRDRLRLIAPIGAAAGLAAAFNAPISAVLFVIEEIVGRWSTGVFGAVVLAAVSSVVVARSFLGSEALFHIPDVQPARLGELAAYAVLGIIGGIVSVLFARGIGTLRAYLKALPRWTQYFQPAIAGALIGTVGYFGLPQVMGSGYATIGAILGDHFTWKLLVLLTVAKLIATTISFTSGTPGGMFAPTLFIGAALGAAVGAIERVYFPHLTGPIAVYALVGMGVLFAGFLRAPMTSVFMVLEVSGDYGIIVPVMVANTLAYMISRKLQPVPIFDLLSRQDGVELPSMEEEREQSVLRIEDAMQPAPAIILSGMQSVDSAMAQVKDSGDKVFLVSRAPFGWNYIERQQLDKVLLSGKGSVALSSLLAEGTMPRLYPDQAIETALRYAHEWKLLAIVHRADAEQLVGVIALEDILAHY
jgi:CIC family chloride channel protein